MSKRISGLSVAALSLVFTSGCVINFGNIGEGNVSLPKDACKVGGGFEISFVLPEDGTVILMDQKTNRNIMSNSMTAGTEFRFSAAEVDKEQYKKWGVDPDKANFVLYFYPKNPKMEPQPQPGVAPLGSKGCKE